MSEHGHLDLEDILAEAPRGELVHWMDPRPMTFGAGGLSLAVAGAFALGLATAMVALGVSRIARAERRMSLPLERKLRGLN